MKARSLRGLVLTLVVLGITVGVINGGVCLADEIIEKDKINVVGFRVGDPYYYVVDTDGVVHKTEMDAVPYKTKGMTYVSVKHLCNALGVPDDKLEWNAKGKILTIKGDAEITLFVGMLVMRVGYDAILMDAKPEVVPPGRVMFLASYIAEPLGFTVNWVPSWQLVVCYPESIESPDVEKIIDDLKANGVRELEIDTEALTAEILLRMENSIFGYVPY